ncbi:hypothetical protein CDAR_601321 [Caerostris darwini]|uniref:Uncharacterized protein n=1 Tax=Caerostris darwini TaxID=1538125 RepID=A0AAV4WUT5_9ARAC|nr:hypothetical protein CDAR_601321 [Caerostris darwini]
MISLPSNTTNIPGGGGHLRKAKVVKTQNRRAALPAAEQKLGRRAQRQSGRISRLCNPLVSLSSLVVPFLLPECRDLIKLPVFSLRSGSRLGGSSIASEKTNLPRSS